MTPVFFLSINNLNMSARAISEASGKRILNSALEANCGAAVCRFATVTPDTDWNKLAAESGWLNSEVSGDT